LHIPAAVVAYAGKERGAASYASRLWRQSFARNGVGQEMVESAFDGLLHFLGVMHHIRGVFAYEERRLPGESEFVTRREADPKLPIGGRTEHSFFRETTHGDQGLSSDGYGANAERVSQSQFFEEIVLCRRRE
jgi:hypothetical protein